MRKAEIWIDGDRWRQLGAWAALIYTDGKCIPLESRTDMSTKYRCKLVAIGKALQHLKGSHKLTIWVNDGSIIRIAKGADNPDHNADLWRWIFTLAHKHKIRWNFKGWNRGTAHKWDNPAILRTMLDGQLLVDNPTWIVRG